MTTVDPPARFGVLTPPRLTDVWSAVKMDRYVAMTGLVCATALGLMLLWQLPKVADIGLLCVGIGLVLKAVADFWDRVRNGKKGSGNGSG